MSVKRVLVVDDSSTIRTIVRASVEVHAPKGTVEVIEAGSVEQALVELDRGVSLVLLDWNMPKVDGLSLLAQVRRRDSALPIVMITALADAAHEASARAAGATDYVTKPFQMAELWRRIAKYL